MKRKAVNLFALLSALLIGKVSAEKPNILLICIDDLRPELNCYGVDYIHSPNIDALAKKGRPFSRHFVQAPTCGSSRYALLTGRYSPTAGNEVLFDRSAKEIVHPSLPAYFRNNGYTTVSVGKVSHHPGGLGGPDWNDPKIVEMPNSWDRSLLPPGKWKHPRGWMHGLANGLTADDPGGRALFEAFDGPDSSYPDGTCVPETLKQMEVLAAEAKPFFLATGILRPHLPFAAPKKYLDLYQDAKLPPIPHPEKPPEPTTVRAKGEFMGYPRWGGKDPNKDPEFALEVRKHYAACVSYADKLVGDITAHLEKLGLAENTIVILWGDHGYHLGEHSRWGKHTLLEESLLAPLIIVTPEITKPGQFTNHVVETLDLFPTLCDLVSLPKPDYLHGESLTPLLENPQARMESNTYAIASHRRARTIRTENYRLIAHTKGQLELYDHRTSEGETKNLAKTQPDKAQALLAKLDGLLPDFRKKKAPKK